MKKTVQTVPHDKMKWKASLAFECLGVEIEISATCREAIEKLRGKLPIILPIKWMEIFKSEIKHRFYILKETNPEQNFTVYKNAEMLAEKVSLEEVFMTLESQIRLTIAEFSEKFVFLHAGVVGWQGKAIVIPGKSFSGKTTLVAELVKRNCEYLSDEYAVIDEKGLVHPFPKKLSIRGIIDDYRQVDFDVEQLGGKAAQAPMSIGFLLLTTYQKHIKKPKIKRHSVGEGVMASIANSISVRHNPRFVFKIISEIANRAIVLEAERGEGGEFANFFLDYLSGERFLNFPSSREKLDFK